VNKIIACKILREETNLNLRDSLEVIDRIVAVACPSPTNPMVVEHQTYLDGITPNDLFMVEVNLIDLRDRLMDQIEECSTAPQITDLLAMWDTTTRIKNLLSMW